MNVFSALRRLLGYRTARFKVVEDRDISVGPVKRRALRVVGPDDRALVERAVAELVRQVEQRHGHQCAVSVWFYRTLEEATPVMEYFGGEARIVCSGAYTVAMAEWAPGGVWADAFDCGHEPGQHRVRLVWR
jgi:hypothetical protein